MDKKGENGKYIAFGLIIGAAAGAAACFVTSTAYVVPALLGFLFAAWGFAGMIPALIGAFAVSFLLMDAQSAAYTLALYIPASLIIGGIIRKKLPWRTAVAMSALTMGLALYLYLCLPSMLAGKNPFEESGQTLQESVTYLVQQYDASAASSAETSLAATEQFAAMIKELTPQIIMYFVCGFAMFFSLIDVIVARALCKKMKLELRPMTHFALWQLSKQYNYVSLAAIAGVVAVMVVGLSNEDAVFAAAACVVLMPLMLDGVCYIEFAVRMHAGKRGLRRALFYIFAVLLMPYSLIFMGLMDRIMRIRKHYTTKKKTDED